MSFKNKQELDIALKIVCVKKDFRLKRMINSNSMYCYKCVHPKYKWWLRSVKLKKCYKFYIRKYETLHMYGSEYITSHNSHAAIKIIGANFQHRYPKGKGPSTKDLKNSICTELNCKESYWKVWIGSEIAKSLVRGTHEHEYRVLDAYNHMLRTSNMKSKMVLEVDENGRFKFFFVAYGAWIFDFAQWEKS